MKEQVLLVLDMFIDIILGKIQFEEWFVWMYFKLSIIVFEEDFDIVFGEVVILGDEVYEDFDDLYYFFKVINVFREVDVILFLVQECILEFE